MVFLGVIAACPLYWGSLLGDRAALIQLRSCTGLNRINEVDAFQRSIRRPASI